MLVEAFTHRPLSAWYTAEATTNEKTWADALLARLPVGGLLIFDLGFFSFPGLMPLPRVRNFSSRACGTKPPIGCGRS
jgi:hypothetical protein